MPTTHHFYNITNAAFPLPSCYHRYGLLGQNDCGKTTLMRAIADGSVDGFPDASEVRTVFVETDIQGDLSHLNCVNYILEWPAIAAMGATEDQVRAVAPQYFGFYYHIFVYMR